MARPQGTRLRESTRAANLTGPMEHDRLTAPHGYLPPWGRAPLPTPPPFTLGRVLTTVGPGVIALGIAIGSGEWLLGPSIIVRYGPALLWITTLAVLLQVILNLEMARYTLYTGEPIVVGFMRTWPGPGFWGWAYGAMSLLQNGWPGWALASATATAALVLGGVPEAGDATLVVAIGYATFAACLLIVTVGRKIERSLEYAMWVMMAGVFGYLLALDAATVSAANWGKLARGLTSFGSLPEGADWPLLAAFAAYSGLGGMSNVYITHWMRDKGFGMAGTTGYIPGALGGKHGLPAHGNVFEVSPASLAGWRAWWKFLNVDQWGIFALGSITGMALTCVLTLQWVPRGSVIGDWAVAAMQTSNIAAALGPVFWYVTLLCGLWILFSTQLGNVDGVPRMITDMLWSGSAAVRRWRGGDVRAVYYTVLAIFAVWGCIALGLARPLVLIVIGANAAGVIFLVVSVHTLIVNRRFLPPGLRASWWREAGLVACALFYGLFAAGTLVSVVN